MIKMGEYIDFIIQSTENPKVMKFVANRPLIEGSLELDRNSDVSNVPLAGELFQYPFVSKIFITANFIAIAKEDTVEWDLVADNVRNILLEVFENYPEVILSKDKKVLFYAEKTPNPSVVKFVSENSLINGFLELKSLQEAQNVPLAKKIFEDLDFVKEIFINDNFISITKTEKIVWEDAIPKIQQSLTQFFETGQKISNIEGIKEENQAEAINKRTFTEIEEKINGILQEYVAPAVENDGGKISLIEFDEQTKIVKMLLQGACSGCPSSTITLKSGIENVLKNFLPDVIEGVEAING